MSLILIWIFETDDAFFYSSVKLVQLVDFKIEWVNNNADTDAVSRHPGVERTPVWVRAISPLDIIICIRIRKSH